MTTATALRRPPNDIGRHLVRTQLRGLEWVLAAYLLVVATVAVLIHLTFELQASPWVVALQLLNWFAVGMGVYLTAVYLPLYVAHGRTRWQVATGSARFSVLFAVWLGAAVVVGFALELGVLHLAGLSELAPDPHPTSSAGAIATTLVLRTAGFLVFIVTGALAGAAFYRSALLGVAIVPPGLTVLVLANAVTTGDRTDSPLDRIDMLVDPTLAVSLLVCLALAAVIAAATWLVIRNQPLRPRSG